MAQQELSREVQEIWELFRAVAKQQEENAKKIGQLSDNVDALTGKWGKFMEGMVMDN